MSWHYSQALVAAYSAANSSDGARSVQSSGSHTHALYCAPDRTRAFSRLSRFGMTCEPLTDELGADVLTWFLAGSRALTYHAPAKAPESTESDQECGRTWRESFARWDRASCSWKTPQCSLLADLDEFSETWPRWGMMLGGECSAQTMPALHTSETGSGFARNWPTPTCHMAKECDAPSEANRNEPTLTHQARGGDTTQPSRLNPEWVEWLMGFPLGWTDLKPLETARFQRWRHSHGGS